MSTNPLNDISRVYLEQVASVDEGYKPIDRKKESAMYRRAGNLARTSLSGQSPSHNEEAKPDYLDFDKDGNKKEPMKKALKDKAKKKNLEEAGGRHGGGSMVGQPGGPPSRDRRTPEQRAADDAAREESIRRSERRAEARFGKRPVQEAKKPNDGNLANNYPPFDKVTRGDVIAGATGKDQMGGKKKKGMKEGFSNWRQDLLEIIATDNEDEQKQIKEKKVKNTVKTSAMGDGIKISEAIETIGGHLVEMVEIEEDYVFEGVLDEVCDAEMFFLDNRTIHSIVEETIIECIEDGYDPEYVVQSIIESIDTSLVMLMEEDDPKASRRSGVLQKVKSAVKAVGKGLARGVGYAAGLAVRGAKAAGRETAAGYQRGRRGSSTSASTTSSASAGGKEEEEKDKKPGLLSRIGSKLKRGLTKAVAKGARAVSRGARNVARRMEGGQTSNLPAKTGQSSEPETSEPEETGRPAKKRRGGPSYKEVKAEIEKREAEKKEKKAKKDGKLDDLLSSIRNEETQLDERTLSKKEMSKREEIVKSMKKNKKGFEERYPGRGEEVMYATATKMAKKIAKS